MVCVRGVPGVTGTLGRPTVILTQPKRGWGPNHHVEAAVDSCSSILFALHVYIICMTETSWSSAMPPSLGRGRVTNNNRNFALYYPKRSESIRVLRTDRKFVMMMTVKVYSKSELVEDREGESALYGVICCCDDRLFSKAVICGHTVEI